MPAPRTAPPAGTVDQLVVSLNSRLAALERDGVKDVALEPLRAEVRAQIDAKIAEAGAALQKVVEDAASNAIHASETAIEEVRKQAGAYAAAIAKLQSVAAQVTKATADIAGLQVQLDALATGAKEAQVAAQVIAERVEAVSRKTDITAGKMDEARGIGQRLETQVLANYATAQNRFDAIEKRLNIIAGAVPPPPAEPQ